MIKLHFWQMAVARITALLIGIVVGAYWHEIFTMYILPLAVVGVMGSLYVLFVVFKQYQKK
jgi:uncharacterized membrane protein YgaE (UPF0421/DUF939 family)